MEKKSVSPIIIKGIITIILGVVIMFYSEDSIKALGLLPGLLITIIGGAQIGFALMAKKNLNHWQWYLAGGIGTTIIGVILMLNPDFTLKLLIIGIGAWFIFQGVQDYIAGNFWKKLGHPNWWYLAISAVINLIIGLLFVFNPLKGALAVTAFIGLGMVFSGIVALVVANFLRSKYNQLQE